MRILGAHILNFRNLEETSLSFSSRVNLFLGENGQGKTNLLEALNLLSLGRSHRGARGEELIRCGADHLHVRLETETVPGGRGSFELALDRTGGRRVKIDGEPLSRRIDLVGRLPAVFFSPESIGLVRGAPERRRRYVDQGVAGIHRDYLLTLQACQRCLRQKTRLLRDLRGGRVSGRDGRREIAAWNRKLAGHAAAVCRGRADYARRIGPFAAGIYSRLAGDPSSLEFLYRPQLAAAKNPRKNVDFEQEILVEIDYIVEEEIRRGRPLSGPQMDDFEVRLAGLGLRTFGSQGETRTAAVSLILAQSDVVHQARHVRPVLFFDDIFSELDRNRSRRLQEMVIENHQIFIATARPEDVAGWRPDGLRGWEVRAGRLESLA